jgi:hypothetical protein
VIAKPTTAQLIEAVRRDLETRVAPEVADPIARMALDMSIAVLGTAAVRSEHELAWMLEECEAIEALARELAQRLPGSDALAQALEEHVRGKGPVRAIADAHAQYARASEVLARAAEAAYDAADAAAIDAATGVLDARRHRQNEVTGGFSSVGRA